MEKMHSGDLKWEFMLTHELGLDSVADTIRQMSERTMHSSKVLFFPDNTEFLLGKQWCPDGKDGILMHEALAS